MAKKRGTTIYYDWVPPLSLIPANDFKPLVLSLIAYERGEIDDDQIPSFKSEVAKHSAMFMFPQMSRARANAENGRKGGEATQEKAFGSTVGSTVGSAIKSSTNTYTNTKTNTDTNTVTITSTKAEVEPTLSQIEEYARMRGREDIAKEFYDINSANKWCDNRGNPISNWKRWFDGYADKKPAKVRYGNFDAKEAFENAIERSCRDYTEEL